MRLRIPNESFRSKKGPVYADACIWPRVIKLLPGNGKKGGLATAHTSMGQHRADLEEVRSYLESNPGAIGREVAMCCFMSDEHARRLVREVRNGCRRESLLADVSTGRDQMQVKST